MGTCSFVFFFATFFRKDFAQWNNAMSPKSNIFPNQNAPSHKKIQNMETKKNKTIKRKKKFSGGYIQFLVFSKIPKHKNTASTTFVGEKPTLTLFLLFCWKKKPAQKYTRSRLQEIQMKKSAVGTVEPIINEKKQKKKTNNKQQELVMPELELDTISVKPESNL